MKWVASVTVTSLTHSFMSAAKTRDGVSRSSSRVYLTSSEVKGWPSDHSTPLRRVTSTLIASGGDRVALRQPRDLFARVVVVQVQELEDRLVQDVAHAPGPAQRIGVHVLRVLDLGQARTEAGDDQRVFASDVCRRARPRVSPG